MIAFDRLHVIGKFQRVFPIIGPQYSSRVCATLSHSIKFRPGDKMSIAAVARHSDTYWGDVGPMFRIAIPSIGFGRDKGQTPVKDDRDVQAEFQEHFDRDLKANGNMDPNLTDNERQQVAQLQVIRSALLVN